MAAYILLLYTSILALAHIQDSLVHQCRKDFIITWFMFSAIMDVNLSTTDIFYQ